MSRVTGKPPTHWRRPITRTYDYNTSLGENYYKPQLDYIATRKGRGNTPPSATTFAERLSLLPPSRRSASATRRADESETGIGIGIGTTSSLSAATADASLGRYASLDDLGLDDDLSIRRRRHLLFDASQENLADRGTSPFLSSAVSGRNRVTFGDKVLDAVGVREMGGSTSSLQQEKRSALSSSSKKQSATRMSSEEGDAIDKILAERRNRRQQGILSVQTADADLFTEDPLKSPKISTRLQQARQQMDEMRDEMRKDADSGSASSRFRQRLRAKREKEMRDEQHDNFFGGSLSALNDIGSSSSSATSAARQFRSEATSSSTAASSAARSSAASSGLKMSSISSSAQNLFADDDDSETAAILSKVEQIRKRAKARIQQINDDVDFPDLQIESSLASRRAAARSRFDDDDLSSDFRLGNASSSSSGGGRAVTISKRTLKTSYDIE